MSLGHAFALMVAFGPIQDGKDVPAKPTQVKVGDVVNGEVTKDSPVVHTPTLDTSYTDAPVRGVTWLLKLELAGPVTIELRSYFFDAYLVVRDAKGEVVAEDDDGLIRTHSRTVLDVVAPAAFDVTACALHGAVGVYELRVVAGRPTALDPKERPGQEIDDARRAVKAVEARFGPDHPATARSLDGLATVLEAAGRYQEARPLYEHAVAIFEKTLGPEDLETARCLNNFAALYDDEGRYDEARRLYERSLAVFEKALGPERTETTTCQNNLAFLLDEIGKYDEAQALFERTLAVCERVRGPADLETARCLNNLAGVLDDKGDYDRARPLYERSLAVKEKVLGPRHPSTAGSLDNLGLNLLSVGKFEQAQSLFERALSIFDDVLGPEHPDTIRCVNNLAGLFQEEGRYEEARPLCQRSLDTCERTLGPEHPATARSLNNLASLLRRSGKNDEAQPLFERALAIREKALGAEHEETAVSLVNLAESCIDRGEYERAGPLLERAVAAKEKTLGPLHPSTARGLCSLARLREAQGRRDEARRLEERARAIFETALGSDHPETAASLNRLAKLLREEGRLDDARVLLERSLEIREKVLGSQHPLTTTGLANLALLSFDRGDTAAARSAVARLLASTWSQSLEQTRRASGGDVATIVAGRRDAVELLLTVARSGGGGANERASYEEVLGWKGQAAGELSSRRDALRLTVDATTRAKADELQSVRAALSNLISLERIKDREQHDRDVEALRRRRQSLETDLASAIASRPQLKPATFEAVRAALPKGAVLLDFLDHALYEPAQRRNGVVVRDGAWSAPSTSAWIVRAALDQPTRIDLGSASALEAAVRNFLDSFVQDRGAGAVSTASKVAAASSEAAVALRRLLWDPIAPHVGDATRLIVSADGALALLPFGILVDGDGRHLVEKYTISNIEDASLLVHDASRAVDAAQETSGATKSPSLLAAGAVDYDAADEAPSDVVARGGVRGGFARAWVPLGATGQEVAGIVRLHKLRFGDTTRLELHGSEPTEERLKLELPKHALVHLATHGYFLADGMRSLAEALNDSEERARIDSPQRRLVATYFPALLCGVVCAGANSPRPGRDNGLLTGEEVSGLDLKGCNLVVLSACESGLGRSVGAGQGAMSLSRSFREAGARTVISSLWNVRDDSTKDLMLDFYDRLWNRNESKLDALRDAQLDMLRKNREKYGDTRPATWGAFVLTGDAD